MNENRFNVDGLTVEVHDSREAMGILAAEQVSKKIQEMMQEQEAVNMIFAAAPSQNEFLEALIKTPDIDWRRVNAFHMDEYIGIASDAPQSFGQWLRTRLFEKLPFRSVHYINSLEPEKECERYAELLREHPTDICCLGIGENGHLAFNDPPVADFDDSNLVKQVQLDLACRQQQVNDGCFASLEEVPQTAITLTIPALMAAKYMCCVVPGSTKAQAVKATLQGEISTACPATILRTHKNATLFLDQDSYGQM